MRILAFFSFILLFATSSSCQDLMMTLDAESIECVSCHEGSVSSGASLSACHMGNCDHPMGVDYGFLASRNRGLANPPLAPAIRLVNNRMGCVSCHIPYADGHEDAAQTLSDGQDKKLSVDNTGSRLCTSCHLK